MLDSPRHSAVVRIKHGTTTLSFFGLLVSGIAIPVSPFSFRLGLRPLRLFTQHFRRNLLPARADLAWGPISSTVSTHLHLRRHTEQESLTYNVLQRLAYLVVIFMLSPL
jgi:cytochrome b subunit of formate dehydrogenase